MLPNIENDMLICVNIKEPYKEKWNVYRERKMIARQRVRTSATRGHQSPGREIERGSSQLDHPLPMCVK